MHYPKTLIIGTIGLVAFRILFGSNLALLGAILGVYTLFKFENLILSTIIIHQKEDISELFDTYNIKKSLEAQIILKHLETTMLKKLKSIFNTLIY